MMKHQPITVLRYISLLQRNTQRYFDLALERDNIGGGSNSSCCVFSSRTASACSTSRVSAALIRVR